MWVLPLPHYFNNLKIGNMTKIETEHLLKSKQIKSKTKSPPPPPPPSSSYITHKICQIWFSCKGRKPRNKKPKGAAENQRKKRLCIAESRKPGLINCLCIHLPDSLTRRCCIKGQENIYLPCHWSLFYYILYVQVQCLIQEKSSKGEFPTVCTVNLQSRLVLWRYTVVIEVICKRGK